MAAQHSVDVFSRFVVIRVKQCRFSSLELTEISYTICKYTNIHDPLVGAFLLELRPTSELICLPGIMQLQLR